MGEVGRCQFSRPLRLCCEESSCSVMTWLQLDQVVRCYWLYHNTITIFQLSCNLALREDATCNYKYQDQHLPPPSHCLPDEDVAENLTNKTREHLHNTFTWTTRLLIQTTTLSPEWKGFRLRLHIRSGSRKLHLNNTMQRLRPTAWCEPHLFHYVHFLVSLWFIHRSYWAPLTFSSA